MKNLLLILIASNILLGQSLPAVVDNSQWFPPVRTQYWNSCTAFSMVYYLKSYIWNRALNRDPKLEENQFSPYFVWNQVISPTSHFSTFEPESDLLLNQGTATVADFGLNPVSEDVFPSLETRKKAFSYRSGYNVLRVNINYTSDNRRADSVTIARNLAALKDSLSQGKCFVLDFQIFTDFNDLYYLKPPIYRYRGLPQDSAIGGHAVAVVGYDDSIGAFKCLNSYGPIFGDSGYFYYDYAWFFAGSENISSFDANFLCDERIGYQPELILNVGIKDFVNGENMRTKYLIIDTLFEKDQKQVDFINFYSYFSFPNFSKLSKINGQELRVGQNNRLFMPLHNHDGNYQLLTDLTDYVKADSFISAAVVINDPISASFIGKDGSVMYQYNRVPASLVTNASIEFVGNKKQIIGRVTDLGDTTVVLENYGSMVLTYQVNSLEWPISVKKSVCTFARKLVTFNISDIADTNQAPVFTAIPSDTLKTNTTSSVSFQFKAMDPDGDSLKYSVSGASEAVIDSLTGLFTYRSNQSGIHELQVKVTDGTDFAIDSFIVKVENTVGVADEDFKPVKYALSQNYPNPFNPTTAINFSIAKAGFVTLKVYNLLGQAVATPVSKELPAGNHSVSFDASRLANGIYLYTIQTNEFSASKKMVLLK